jgi:hypothetical protein
LQVDNVEILMSLLIGYNKGKKRKEREDNYYYLSFFQFFFTEQDIVFLLKTI